MSNFSAIRVVQLPRVHADRVNAVSQHLKDKLLDARHVFLKSYVFRTDAKVGVISDIDVVLTTTRMIARKLLEGVDETTPQHKIQCEKRVAVMCRRYSPICPHTLTRL